MNAFTGTSEFPAALSISERTSPTPATAKAGFRLNGHIFIFSLVTALALATASECKSITHLPSLIYGAVLWVWWGCIASAAWNLGKRVPIFSSFSPKTISIHVLVGSAVGAAHLLLLGSLLETLGFTASGWQAQATRFSVSTSLLNFNRTGIELLTYGFVVGIASIVQYQIRVQRDAIKSLELQRQLSAAQLRALQMQLEPHFLFNTLNAITTLVELGRQKEAAEMLFHLNAILKSTLKRETPEKVPLSQEFELVANYLAIEQVRFADRLHINIAVDPSALNGLVPCFLLQPIVENAIRHGIAHCENEGMVEASARREGSILHLTVRDSGRCLGGQPQDGHGIGLSNTRDRLKYFYQDEFAMKAEPLETGGYEVAIAIPYECN